MSAEQLGKITLRDMSLSRDEKREEEIGAYEPADFSYGLRLNLGDNEIEKLGISMPGLGESFIVVGLGTVKSVSENEHGKNIELQVEKLALETREEDTITIE